MNLTLSVDDNTIRAARQRAEAMGTSVNQLVRDYLEILAGRVDREDAISEFQRMSRDFPGNSGGAKFDREELYTR